MANSLRRYDPLRDLARIDPFRDLDDLFRDFTRGFEQPHMRMDVSEDEHNYIIKAEIPGVQKEDIKVAVSGNQVSLTAEIKDEQDGGGRLRSERYFGQLHRSFTLPQEVDDDQAEARYENGVLHLTLPKRQNAGARQLTIQ